MRAIGEIKRRTPPARVSMSKHRRDRRDVGQMRSASKWIVDQSDVAFFEIERVHDRAHRQRHRAQMHRHVIAHGDRLAARIVDRAGVVAALLDVGRIGGLAQHHAHFLGDRSQQMPEQFELYAFFVVCLGLQCT